jgi:hypothetical protein
MREKLSILMTIKAIAQSLVLLSLAGSVVLGVAVFWLKDPSSLDNRKPQAMLILSTSATGSKNMRWIVPAKTTSNGIVLKPEPIACFGDLQQGAGGHAPAPRPVKSL